MKKQSTLILLACSICFSVFAFSVRANGNSEVPDISKFNEKIYIAMENKQTYKGDINKYATKYNEKAKEDYLNKSVEEIKEIIGEPAYKLKYREKTTAEYVHEREVWVYLNKGDRDALYLSVKYDRVEDYVIDDFKQLDDAEIVSIFDTVIPEK